MGAKSAKKAKPQGVPRTDAADTKKAKPSEADLAAATRLREIWKQKKGKATQETFHEGWSQSTVSQYLTGLIPLNFYACCVFASKLGCRVEEIRSDLPEQKLGLIFHVPGVPLDTGESRQWDSIWSSYSAEEKARILAMADMAAQIKKRR